MILTCLQRSFVLQSSTCVNSFPTTKVFIGDDYVYSAHETQAIDKQENHIYSRLHVNIFKQRLRMHSAFTRRLLIPGMSMNKAQITKMLYKKWQFRTSFTKDLTVLIRVNDNKDNI